MPDAQAENATEAAVVSAIDWSLVMGENEGWLRRLIVARTASAELVDDLLQDVSLAVTQSTARPTRSGEVGPWLCKIAIRQCALALRSRGRQQRKLDRFRQTCNENDDGSDPIFCLMHAEQREIIRDELRSLEPQQRELLVWKFVQSMSYKQIAARLEITSHAAEYRVIEARKQLRRRLQARGIEGRESL